MSSSPSDIRSADASSRPVKAEPPVRRVLVFCIIALALMMMAIDGTIVATVLHTLQRGLDTTINWAGWTITAYSFGFVVMLPISGKLAERYGRRKVFIGSVCAFTITSLLCGLADNIFVLIALRALQAAGGAGFTPSATGIIVDHFGDARDRAVSLFGSIFPIGAMIGPIFGGLFVTYWSWRWAFYVNVPIGIVVVLLALKHMPHDKPRAKKARSHPDIPGVVLMGVGILVGMLSVSVLGEQGLPAGLPAFAGLFVMAAVLAWAFFRHIGRASNPFIAPRLINGPGFGVVNLVNSIFGGLSQGAIVLVPLYAANRYGIDALGAGTLLIAQGAAAVVFSVASALALRRTGHRLPLRVGSAVIVLGLVLIAIKPPFGIAPYLWLVVATFLVGAGGGTINPPSRNAGLQLAPENSSTLAALRTLSLQIGSISAVSIVTAALAGSGNPGLLQAWTYAVGAAILVLAMPLISRVPEHHGAW
ncbi:MAG TPA: MFS transporter [Castellaniella sp.]|uniref:MFS transporter n=1 Tax=Castellaniella sp. TaxID=1955812 RepID=UPI002F048739